MKHARPDYDRFQDPAGKIPPDEPVFLIRGQDKAGHHAVRAWARYASNLGADRQIVLMAVDHANVMEAWASKLPDLPADGSAAPIPLIPSDDAKQAEYFEGRMQHWLNEAQRLALLVRSLGGDPEPTAEQPNANWLNRPIPEDVQIGGINYTAGVHFGSIVRLARIGEERRVKIFELQDEREQFCMAMSCTDKPGVMLKIARELQKRNGELLTAQEADRSAAQERTQICEALGCVDEPGIPLKHVLDLIDRKAKAYAREIAVLKMWDPATPTERQELDRMRRGWGPSTPTERNRRHADVLGCLQILSSAMHDVTFADEDAIMIPEEVQQRLDEAYNRLEKRYAEMRAVADAFNKEPMEWPDIKAAEERGAMAAGFERVRHLKRGIEADVLGEAEAQVAVGAYMTWPEGTDPEGDGIPGVMLHDGLKLTVYRHDGKLWVRPTDEFRDGRFETITAPDSRQSETIAAELEEIAGKASEEAMAESSTDRGLALLKRARTYRRLAEVMRRPGFGGQEA